MSQRKITKRADGRYKVNYGARQFYGKTKAEAIKKREEYIASENIGLNLDYAEMTFRDYGLNWLRSLPYRMRRFPAEAVCQDGGVYFRYSA